MIIWKGFGILALAIPLGLGILCMLLFGDNSVFPGIACAIGGIIVWFLGNRLNTNNERIVIHPKTGQQVLHKINHSLFWIRMELWAPSIVILGLFIAMSGLTNGQSEKLAAPLALAMLVLVAAYSFYKKKDKQQPSRAAVTSSLKAKASSGYSGLKKTTAPAISPKIANSSISPERKMALSEEDKRKKQYYAELRSNRNKPRNFEPSDHSKYIPKKSYIPTAVQEEE